jgi:hypothetical protein
VTSDESAPASNDVPDVPSVPAPGHGTDAMGGAGVAAAQAKLRLLEVVREVEKHVADLGWDQNPRLFALARTAELVALEPELREALGPAADDPASLTPIEQEQLDHSTPLDEVLARTMWPDEVAGAAVVLERVMLPPTAETDLPDDPAELEAMVASHPERQDVRMAVVVTREGLRMCAVRMRSHDTDDQVLTGEDLVPGLAEALAATLA